ncbi:uncharacterized protein LOC118644388 isoform X2 [Monomorium pharaonis]|uniref:uncharacterized protein LOC118644388 isoform X2 n=1 Tax=Monomorium pharaonis TaxID=307658 RepID=UPI0017477E20|nr:uncharacterized protein LOC118644388 isoform X2 [Monomorium pharaonis]
MSDIMKWSPGEVAEKILDLTQNELTANIFLVRHLRISHGLTIHRGIGNTGFKCGQDGCWRNFKYFYTLRRHIRQCHKYRCNDDLESEFIVNNNQDWLPNPDNNEDEFFGDNAAMEEVTHMENYEDVYENLNFDLYTLIIRVIARLQSKGSITGSILSDVLDEFEEVILNLAKFFKNKVLKYFQARNATEDLEVVELLSNFDFENPFDDLHTLKGQIKALKINCGYIEPIEIPLGYRMENLLHSETGTYTPKIVLETYQYVPIIDTLKLVLSNTEIKEAILSEQSSTDDVLASFVDGDHFKNHPLFQMHRHALRIQLYYDELEIVNPLGSKTGIHKLGVFYYTIQNIPAYINSDLGSIHVLLLCSDADTKKYGFDKILSVFLNDLEKLESDDGVKIMLDNEEFNLHATITAFCGDTLAVHEVFNMLGPKSNKFCRMCLYSREDLLAGSTKLGNERTEEVFNEHLQYLHRHNFSALSMTATGIRGDCCLNKSRYFHISRNKIFDVMHDILCGVGPMILKCVLYHYICITKQFTVDYFNNKITSFQYGFVENKNKPSANFSIKMLQKNDHLLSQKAMQMWVLLRAFPFMVAEKIEREDEHMDLILILLRIMEIVLAPKVTKSLMPYLQALTKDLMDTFRKLYPNINLINKFHHLIHYADCILWAGPLRCYFCMRFEAKHAEIKLRAQNVNNFKNPPKTLIRVCQCVQSAKWGAGDVKLERTHSASGKMLYVQETQSREFLLKLGYVDVDNIFRSKNVKINGVEFRPGLFVCLEAAVKQKENLPTFGKIKEIILLRENEVYLLIFRCKTIIFDPYFNAFCIELENADYASHFISVSSLAHFQPFCSWTESISNGLYISLRHIIL